MKESLKISIGVIILLFLLKINWLATIAFIFGYMIGNFRWESKSICKHNNKTETFRCFQERYVKYQCKNYNEIIYTDID